MCLAIPGRIVRFKHDSRVLVVAYPGEDREVLSDPTLSLAIGDYVLVQMGVVIKKIDQSEAQESLSAWEKS